ncbi:MAG: type II toxin-antitoxin system prevent-host-death family antitoxin [Geminicoccaceae bacterium]|nr:type II toxin-antitoxin system prevent-host-death family antitoxin [Geminicoccaceae bacterium]
MQTHFTLREAKARLSEILDLVAAGVPVEITRRGAKRGCFRIVSTEGTFQTRSPGALKNKITIVDGFDDEDPGIIADFEGAH